DLVAQARARPAEPLPGDYQFDPSMLAVLTEYEEHRLRENIRAGRPIYRVHTAFDVLTIDEGLKQLKGRLKTVGEVITYLPATKPAADNQIELDVIVGGLQPLEVVSAAVAAAGGSLSELPHQPKAVAVELPALDGTPALGSATGESRDGELTLKSVAQTVRVD